MVYMMYVFIACVILFFDYSICGCTPSINLHLV